ncbi:hypothetical protein GCM10023172_06030 [Hymenobacter ginsengisoli]|uniref:Uncharacterized protein n=1 Tax=Hymenobacter ginsengisoli TaxID=1051626 RepID=A0ABP8Q0H0_9BACT|nr:MULTISPECIES: hypothetical protein [unclassified Hymenobacter]MBO2033925.1 hypothetical protein [Hymenobacter sp. BT559]
MGCRSSFYFLSTAALLALSSCDKGAATDPAAPGAAHQHGAYFDVRGLLDAQVRQLTASRPGVEKRVSLRGSPPETVRVPQVKWADELQVFYQADINKAALRGAYAVDSASLPGGAVRRTYRLRPGHDNAPVLRLDVTSQASQPQEIVARLRQDNALFFGQKDLRLMLQNGHLSQYSASGVQKLVLFDTLRYTTTMRVL